jgi:hypothetical protein
MIRRTTLALCLVASLALTMSAATASAESPSSPCTPETRMDVWWDSTGAMYECRCVRFPGETERWCSWFKVPAARKPTAAKPKTKKKTTPSVGGTIAPVVAVVSPAVASNTAGTAADPFLASDAWAQANL